MIEPTPPIELRGHDDRFAGSSIPVGEDLLAALAAICEVETGAKETAEASRDWWPLAMHWALAGQVPRRAAAVVRPSSASEVSAVASLCHAHHVPLTAAGGRSGVCGASVPVFGGVVLDTTAMRGILAVDETSGLVEVLPGTFGPDMEGELRERHGLTVGHFPQSFDLATVGGWVACRGAGQYSTRYGKIEDIVSGLEVVLANGDTIVTGRTPAAAQGPDLTQLFVGSEGTLGIITRVWLRAHPLPEAEQRAAYSFTSFEAGLEACRRMIRSGATPAVLRLYDAAESHRGQRGDGVQSIMLVLDEGDATIVAAMMDVIDRAALACGAEALDTERVEAWMHHRNDTSALQALTLKGFVVDTMEIAGPWAALPRLFDETRAAIMAVPHARAATCHLSHSYLDGACLYFTFAATPPATEVEQTYIALWDAGQRAVLAGGGNLSHHHGVGINRARFAAEALGPAHDVMIALKHVLDPHGVLNPGKLGLPSPFGASPWP